MKIIFYRKLPFLFLLLSLSLFATAKTSPKKARTVSPFSKISVSSGIDLYLTQGEAEGVWVEADTDIPDKIITEVKGETLHIYSKDKSIWDWGWKQSRKVYVTFDDLLALDASAGSDVIASEPVTVDQISIAVSSGSDVEFKQLSAQSVHVNASSGADAVIAGTTKNLVATSSSGSDIDCEDLIADTCQASASSGSDIIIHATRSIIANANSGGDISYKGNPAQKTIDESSGGHISSL